jgi:hypothetical protein
MPVGGRAPPFESADRMVGAGVGTYLAWYTGRKDLI